ncbi:MAG: nitrilase-related carbon-nitrogen hydrolase [Actinomycetota bacterium]|nr:nitrilase-related carbon-nitrogen hydrolase [Actinomycetota bacterium]
MVTRFPEPYVAAVVQWAPSFCDSASGTARACAAIEAAAAEGARLVVFPEAWLTGYPYFQGVTRHPDYFPTWQAFAMSAIEVPGPEIDEIGRCARAVGAEVVLGVNERDRSDAVYNTMVFIGADGTLRGKHRKLIPTITESLVWSRGDGSDLDAHATGVGRIGGLMCYEHNMALARYACCTLGIQVHAALWPGFSFMDQMIDASNRQLAMENACFVMSAREVMSIDSVPSGLADFGDHSLWNSHGGSAIIAPGGGYLAGPVFDQETILTAEIDLRSTLNTKWWVNGTANYSRPDVFRLDWDRRQKPPVVAWNCDEPRVLHPPRAQPARDG